jgi:hypothetical protein
MISWSILFYVGKQLAAVTNPNILTHSSSDFTGLLIGVGVETSALWAIFGAYSQQFVKNIRRES